MKHLIVLSAIVLATPALAQTKSASEGGAYAPFVNSALQCMAGTPGDAAAQDACIVAAVEDCQSKAGIYEACLEALRAGFDAAILRVEAQELKQCDGKLDSACSVVLRGHALIRSGQGLDAEGWATALTKAQ
ncbi:MAG: hypothetical protein AB8B82_06110 [Roseovarius sp.]